jgi:hypothetical protein
MGLILLIIVLLILFGAGLAITAAIPGVVPGLGLGGLLLIILVIWLLFGGP